ncbi:hypothetical protein BJY01DRAFT_23372 [Aspergillus pseudoustus]|uniref:Uncharacterized protein n=1 Tax=Aspergillus pseudoustus TaxID=1810923 RepID=A0ABR4JIT4_9EURO
MGSTVPSPGKYGTFLLVTCHPADRVDRAHILSALPDPYHFYIPQHLVASFSWRITPVTPCGQVRDSNLSLTNSSQSQIHLHFVGTSKVELPSVIRFDEYSKFAQTLAGGTKVVWPAWLRNVTSYATLVSQSSQLWHTANMVGCQPVQSMYFTSHSIGTKALVKEVLSVGISSMIISSVNLYNSVRKGPCICTTTVQ